MAFESANEFAKHTAWLNRQTVEALTPDDRQALRAFLQAVSACLGAETPMGALSDVLRPYAFQFRLPQLTQPKSSPDVVQDLAKNFLVVLRPEKPGVGGKRTLIDDGKLTWFGEEFEKFSKQVTDEYFVD